MSVWLESAAVYSDKSSVLPMHFGSLAFGYGLNEAAGEATEAHDRGHANGRVKP